MSPSPHALPESAAALCIFLIALVPLAAAGIALINTGMSRSRSAGHAIFSSLAVIATAALVYFVIGFAFEGAAGRAFHALTIAGKPWNLLGAERLFFRSLEFNGSSTCLAAWLQIFTVGIAALIPVGAGSDRWRLDAACISTALLAAWTYPLFAHWVWGGGWLAQLGANYGLGRGFVDAGGSSTIHAVGGLTALAICWILGGRRGKYSLGGMPTAVPGHNAVLVLFGCLLALLGWTGINAAGSLLFAQADLSGVVLAAVNTFLCACSAAAAAALTTRSRFSKPDASLTANGWIGGLVASSAGCVFLTPLQAAITGAVAGVLVTYGVDGLERLEVDDPTGAISVHALGGIWGVLAVGVFAHFSAGGQATASGQFLAQLVGVVTLIGFVLPLAYAANWAMARLLPYRVAPEGERLGMDLYELGAGAYPDFATYDEFTHR